MANAKLETFAKKYRPAAVAAARGSRIFPDTILVAAALESKYGQSALTKNNNNFFGVKGKGSAYTTKEFINGKWVTVKAAFKKYKSPLDSFKDYVKFVSGPRYVKAGVTRAQNVPDQVKAIKAGGYATDPGYVNKLVSLYRARPKTVIATGTGLTLAAIAGIYFFSNGKQKV